METSSAITVSAPGKVLIVGGYLVLQEGVPGLVVSTSSRFFATVEATTTTPSSSSTSTSSSLSSVPVLIVSSQFHETWTYTLSIAAPHVLTPTSTKADGSPKRNPYAEYAVEAALCASSASSSSSSSSSSSTFVSQQLQEMASKTQTLHIRLEADNEFYSQRAHLVARKLPVCLASLSSLPRFLPCPLDEENTTSEKKVVMVNKTGLGSSAALVTSLTGAIMTFFKAVDLVGSSNSSSGNGDDSGSGSSSSSSGSGRGGSSKDTRAIIHDVAQVAHGLAQGKIGSGFDVCSASFGSIVFSRIPPKALGKLMDDTEIALRRKVGWNDDSYAALGKTLLSLSDSSSTVSSSAAGTAAAAAWTFSATSFSLPKGLVLMLADVAGGSETPGMVRQVLAWRDTNAVEGTDTMNEDLAVLRTTTKDGEEEEEEEQTNAIKRAYALAVGPTLWKQLAAANARVAVVVEQLRVLSEAHVAEFTSAIQQCATCVATEWMSLSTTSSSSNTAVTRNIISKLAELAASFATSRRLIREMGIAAGVPIEPEVQTKLADATLQVPGVVCAGVPGAGGFDALFAIIVDASSGTDGGSSSGSGSNSSGGVREAVEACWLEWPGGGLTPLPLRDGPGRGQAGAGLQQS